MNLMSLMITILFLILYSSIFFKYTGDFEVSKLVFAIGIIVPTLCYNMCELPVLLVLSIMIYLSFVDIKYYEVHKNSYFFLLIPVLIILSSSPYNIIGAMLVFVVFFALFKLSKEANIGGADIKISLILAMTIPFYNSLIFLLLVFLVNIVIYMIIFVLNKKVISTIKMLPMIPSILIAWILANYIK